jgi:hypothetical protein
MDRVEGAATADFFVWVVGFWFAAQKGVKAKA